MRFLTIYLDTVLPISFHFSVCSWQISLLDPDPGGTINSVPDPQPLVKVKFFGFFLYEEIWFYICYVNVLFPGKGNKPYISLPKGKGIKLTIAEERDKRLAAK